MPLKTLIFYSRKGTFWIDGGPFLNLININIILIIHDIGSIRG